MACVLVIEDHEHVRAGLCRAFAGRGHLAVPAETGERGIELGLSRRPEAAVVDLSLPRLGGLGAFAALKAELPRLVGVGISGVVPAGDGARTSAAAGLAAFLPKPFDVAALVHLVELHLRAATHPPVANSPALITEHAPPPAGMVGSSAVMRKVYALVARVAPLGVNVLIEGETGTGKELVARGIHAASGRSGRFVAVNCAVVPRELLEAELFGSERGAFTGAVSRAGHFEEATSGTLFLDEIGEMAPGAQATLLRVLEEKAIRRLGGAGTVSIDVRVVAATNANLDPALPAQTFRRDLHYRLRQGYIRLPPLRERDGDLLELVDVLLPRVCAGAGTPVKRLSPEALDLLTAHAWPGNVRELEDVLLQAVLQAGEWIESGDLSDYLRPESTPAWQAIGSKPRDLSLTAALAELRSSAERRWIEAALAASSTQAEAAQELGINVRTLYEKMALYAIVGPRSRARR